jgi:hypothetical protein
MNLWMRQQGIRNLKLFALVLLQHAPLNKLYQAMRDFSQVSKFRQVAVMEQLQILYKQM